MRPLTAEQVTELERRVEPPRSAVGGLLPAEIASVLPMPAADIMLSLLDKIGS